LSFTHRLWYGSSKSSGDTFRVLEIAGAFGVAADELCPAVASPATAPAALFL